MTTYPAVVTYEAENGQVKWKYEQIPAPRELQEHELSVRIVSVGICHTDLFVSHLPSGALGVTFPKVLGHEGAGYVEAVGSGVTVAAKGDPVLLSFNHCATCDLCKSNDQTYCENFSVLNVVGEPGNFPSGDNKGPSAKFFGQSSFASRTIVDQKCIVNVKDLLQTAEELKACAPLGCGLMTGAGASIKYLKPHDIVIVTGLGAVGMGAIMAAKQLGPKAIIAIDRVEARLNLAKELGATHIYNTAGKDLSSFVADVRALVDGQRISYAFDTTGYVPLIEQCMLALGKRGRLLQIGVTAHDAKVNLTMIDFFHQNKAYEIHFLGDAKPQETIPKILAWYKDGKFPFDKFVQFYPAEKFEEALEAMKSQVIKPILVF